MFFFEESNICSRSHLSPHSCLHHCREEKRMTVIQALRFHKQTATHTHFTRDTFLATNKKYHCNVETLECLLCSHNNLCFIFSKNFQNSVPVGISFLFDICFSFYIYIGCIFFGHPLLSKANFVTWSSITLPTLTLLKHYFYKQNKVKDFFSNALKNPCFFL